MGGKLVKLVVENMNYTAKECQKGKKEELEEKCIHQGRGYQGR